MKIAFNHMQRSGGHAVIEFVISNINGSTTFYNNCTEYSVIPAQTVYYGKPPYANIIYSFENISCEQFGNIECCNSKFIILRSFENFLASIWMFSILNDNIRSLTKQEIIMKWVDHAKFCIDNPDKSILFDIFVQDIDYRRNLCKRLSIPYKTSKSLQQPAMFGSTFGNINGVLSRHQQMSNNAEYVQYLKRYSDIVNLSNSIFQKND